MKYIDAEKLKAAIERLQRAATTTIEELQMDEPSERMRGELDAYDDILYFIDSLQQEQPSEDLEAEIKRYLQEEHDRDTTVRDVARHFANWQKEQMLKDAWEREVKIDSGGYPYIDITAELYDYEHDVPLAKEGDLVKIIIVKSDESI